MKVLRNNICKMCGSKICKKSLYPLREFCNAKCKSAYKELRKKTKAKSNDRFTKIYENNDRDEAIIRINSLPGGNRWLKSHDICPICGKTSIEFNRFKSKYYCIECSIRQRALDYHTNYGIGHKKYKENYEDRNYKSLVSGCCFQCGRKLENNSKSMYCNRCLERKAYNTMMHDAHKKVARDAFNAKESDEIDGSIVILSEVVSDKLFYYSHNEYHVPSYKLYKGELIDRRIIKVVHLADGRRLATNGHDYSFLD